VNLIRNFISLASAELISKLLTFAAFAYVARVVGPDGFGYLEFAGAVLICAGLVIDQGFGPYGAREIAKEPRRTPELVSEIVLARFVLAIAAYSALLAFTLLVDLTPVVSRLLLVYGLSLLVMPLLLQWVFQGHDLMPTVGTIQVIRQAIFATLVFALVRGREQLWLVAAAEVAGVSAAVAYGLLQYRRLVGGAILTRPKITGRLFREAVPIGLSQMFWLIRMYGPTMILGMIAAAEDVGFFAGAMRILIALHTFVFLYHFNLLPSLARAWQKADGSFAALLKKSLHGVAWMGAAAVVLWVIVSPVVVTTVYGQAFKPAAPVLQWLSGVCVVAWLSGHYRFGLIAAGHQIAELKTAAVGALVVALLVPIGYGARGPEGAAIALFVAEVTVWAGSWAFGRRNLQATGHGRLLVRPAVALLFVSGLLWSLPITSWVAQAPIAGVSIATLAFLFDAKVRGYLQRVYATRRRAGRLVTKQLFDVTR
jgi:O-antigen/teichoic acid export membrane protein